MDKKTPVNLNWKVPPKLAEEFDAFVTDRHGGKAKWVGAAGAIIMYLMADDDQRQACETLGKRMRTESGAAEVLAQLPQRKDTTDAIFAKLRKPTARPGRQRGTVS